VINDSLQEYFLDKRPEVQSAFEKQMNASGRAIGFLAVNALSQLIRIEAAKHCRAADPIVVSAVDVNGSMGFGKNFVERFVIAVGRPVLVQPSHGEVKVSFDNIVLGWDQSREANRAPFDTLPFLKLAKNVNVATVDPLQRGEVAGA
jgi:hypothetical protein